MGIDVQIIALGLVWFLVFVFSTSLHEAAHAFAALKLGDPTAYHGGQVSLNPAPHIQREPFGMVIVPVLSYILAGWMMGWASAPYDPFWADRYPRRAAVMALAGPAANLSLLLLAGVAVRTGVYFDLFHAPERITFDHLTTASADGLASTLATILSIVFTLNLLLMVFNLIPLPPLDGSGALPLILHERQWRRYQEMMSHPGASIIGLIIAWNVIKYLFDPIHLFAINVLYFPEAKYG